MPAVEPEARPRPRVRRGNEAAVERAGAATGMGGEVMKMVEPVETPLSSHPHILPRRHIGAPPTSNHDVCATRETAFPITGGMARCPRNRIGNRSRGRLTRSRRLTPGYQMARVRNEGKIAVAKESLRFILPSPGCQNGNLCLDGFFKMILARSPGFKGIVVQIWILEILSFR